MYDLLNPHLSAAILYQQLVLFYKFCVVMAESSESKPLSNSTWAIICKNDESALVAEQRREIAALKDSIRDFKYQMKEMQSDNDEAMAMKIRILMDKFQEMLTEKDQQIEQLKCGHGLVMNEVWCGMFEAEQTRPMAYWPWHYSTRTLHDFLSNLERDVVEKDHAAHVDRVNLAEEEDSEEEDEDEDMVVE
jgi:hemolysin-activating ACP:hemolysin acyltransferase